jgi:tetratricopeptide (TPR) repeat protein
MERAWEAAKPADGAKWARKALDIDPDQLDAYILLSKATQIKAEQIAFLNEGTRRGIKIWAEAIKRPAQSYFWQDMDTRPFMRNVHWLALLQWETGQREEAIKNGKFLLKINPNDNQGIRHLLLNWYPVLQNWDAHSRLIKKYNGDWGSDYLYARCLNLFQSRQDTYDALKEAFEANPYIVRYLVDRKRQPPKDNSTLSGFVTQGSEAEAHVYAEAAREGWESAEGALDWLFMMSISDTG